MNRRNKFILVITLLVIIISMILMEKSNKDKSNLEKEFLIYETGNPNCPYKLDSSDSKNLKSLIPKNRGEKIKKLKKK